MTFRRFLLFLPLAGAVVTSRAGGPERAPPAARWGAKRPRRISMLRLIGFVVLAVIVIVLLMVFGLLDAIF